MLLPVPILRFEGGNGDLKLSQKYAIMLKNIQENDSMPSINWLGKEKAVNHHNSVPFHIPDERYTFGDNADGNMIIKGDNLLALKSLLPKYENKIKCVYIDPPYNTGNEGWVYNDNVNDPKIKKWLGEVVGREGADLSRHDKWLCMMYPRLRLLQRLLADDGAIFISIDDNEQANLKLICDEIFGADNFKTTFIWQHRKSSQNDIDVSLSHNYTLVYTKNKENHKFYPLPVTPEKFANPDNDPRGLWVADPMDAPNIRPNLTYPIKNPNTGAEYLPPSGRHWRISPEKFADALADGRIIFGKNGKGRPQYKRFLFEAEQKGTNTFTIWNDIDTATNATKNLMSVFGGEKVFDTPKPTALIERILRIATDSGDIILDSFAGSGTTAHAVLNLNKQDGGNRKFILVEMEDYAETITAERVKRVIKGYGGTAGTGGGFTFCELGEKLLLENGSLNKSVPEERIYEYIWYTETRKAFEKTGSKYLLGIYNNTAYYFNYEKDKVTSLDLDFLKIIKTKADRYLIYADTCLLSQKDLIRFNITFKKITRDIKKY